MRFSIRRYFGKDVSLQDRVFFLASFLSSLACFLFILIGILLRIDKSVLLICASIFLISTSLFFFSRQKSNCRLYSMILLIVCNVIGLPTLFFISTTNSVEIPIYYIIGLTFSLVLLDGKLRVIMFGIQMIIDCVTIVYCFGIRTQIHDYSYAMTYTDYVRIELAVFITGVLCGSLIYYRNHMLKRELETLKKATKNAEEVSLAKDMFLVNVSHEIRTPLNAIIGTTNIVLDSDASAHIKEMAYNISNSSHALLSITSDLLDFSRMNTDEVKVVNEPYNIEVMLNDIINLMSVRLLDSSVDFFVNIDPSLPRILVGDSGKIRQIMINLLSNAIKYTKEGSITLRVSFAYEDKDSIRLNFSVIDTGIGIEKENINKIFEPMHRSGTADTDHSVEGNGLGLALCKKLSETMNAKLTCESVFGEGSTFFFSSVQKLEVPNVGGMCGSIKNEKNRILLYSNGASDLLNIHETFEDMELPYLEVYSDEEFLRELNDETFTYYFVDSNFYDRAKERINDVISDWSKLVVLSACNYSYSGEPFDYVLTKPINCLNVSDLLNKSQGYMTRRQEYEGNFKAPDANILVIDDNLVNLDVAATLLEKYEANVITAASGNEGIITLKKESVDLVFLDYMMPDMDGIDTLKEIRKIEDEHISSVPVISLTANVVSGAKEMFLSEGFDDYLSKPIEVDKLERMLLDYLPKEKIKYDI